MTTIVSIDELNTVTEMPRQTEAPPATPENKQAFDEAVSRFQTALGGGEEHGALSLELGGDELGGDELGGELCMRQGAGKLDDGKLCGADVKDSAIPRFDDSTDVPDQSGAQVVLQAAPMMTVPLESAAVQQQVSDSLKVASVESSAAMRSQMLVSAVEEVCEAILVSPGVQPGQGEVRIQLKADVLSGTVVFLEAKGTTITVAFNPATADVAEILSRNITQFEQHLAGRVHNYQISARVKRLKG